MFFKVVQSFKDVVQHTYVLPVGLLREYVTWVDIIYWAVTTLCALLFTCVFMCVCVVSQGAAAVSLRGQPALLWDVHPDGHHHEQHRSGSRGPRAGQRTAQQRESHWRLQEINKHLEGHNKHTGCQTHSQTEQRLDENVQTNISFEPTVWFIGIESVLLNRARLFARTEEQLLEAQVVVE